MTLELAFLPILHRNFTTLTPRTTLGYNYNTLCTPILGQSNCLYIAKTVDSWERCRMRPILAQ